MISILLITLALVLACVAIHVKVLIWLRGNTIAWGRRPIVKLGFIVFSLLITHIIEIMLFALTFHILISANPDDRYLRGTAITEAQARAKDPDVIPMREVIYFSFATYTTVGYGDVTPYGEMQILAQVEALSGLLLVGCSASLVFTFLQEFLAHHRKTSQ